VAEKRKGRTYPDRSCSSLNCGRKDGPLTQFDIAEGKKTTLPPAFAAPKIQSWEKRTEVGECWCNVLVDLGMRES